MAEAIGDTQRFSRAYKLIPLTLTFRFLCLLVVAGVLAWRGGDWSRVLLQLAQ